MKRPLRAGSRSRSQRVNSPPFCPNAACQFHSKRDGFVAIKRGRASVRRDRRPLQIFQCKHCRRRFRESVFTEDYWRHYRRLSSRVFPLIADGQALRQAARTLGVGVDAVLLSQRWLHRQSLLIHLDHLRRAQGGLGEALVLDGLRNLVGSVHQMAEVTTAYGAESGFSLALVGFGTRYGGALTQAQRESANRSASRFGPPLPRGRERSVRCILRLLEPAFDPSGPIQIRTDEEPNYRPPVRELAHSRPILHTTVSGRARRDSRNPLWQANHRHRFARHAMANLKRETIAFSRTTRGLVERFTLHSLFCNLAKGVSERSARGRRTTPAMLLGLARSRLSPRAIFGCRRFPVREELPEVWRATYEGRISGWSKERPIAHQRVYAY